MKKGTDEPTDVLAYRIAWNRALGVSIEDIAKMEEQLRGHSRSTVYRAYRVAQQSGMLITEMRVPLGEHADMAMLHVLDYDVARRIRAGFSEHRRPREVIVVPNAPEKASEDERAVIEAIRRSEAFWDMEEEASVQAIVDDLMKDPVIAGRMPNGRDRVWRIVESRRQSPYTPASLTTAEWIARAAATRLQMAVARKECSCIGVSYGRLCHGVASAIYRDLREYAVPGRSGAAVDAPTVFSMVGSLSGLAPYLDRREQASEHSANNCAQRLAASYNAPPAVVITQQSHVPAELAAKPALFHDILRYIGADQSVKAVFGKGFAERRLAADHSILPDPAEMMLATGAIDGELAPTDGLLSQADTLLTGMGGFRLASRGPRLFGLTREDVIALTEAGVAGDIAGRLFYDPTRMRQPDALELINATNARFLTPTLGDFIRVAHRSRANGGKTLGTVVMATGGAERAHALRCLIEYYGAISVLVIDAELAQALLAQIARPMA